MRNSAVISGLAGRVKESPDATALTFLDDGETPGQTMSWQDLDEDAGRFAAGLLSRGLSGARVVVSLPSGPDFLSVLLGCFYAGAVAVPAPPLRLRAAYDLERLEGMVDDCAAALLVVPPVQMAGQQGCAQESPLRRVPWVSPADLREAVGFSLRLPNPNEIAFLQYTSGSTTRPKGVAVRHRNLAANFDAVSSIVDFNRPMTFVSWLPLHHDMGLIGAALRAIHHGFPLVLMSPAHFLQNPLRWLRAISKYEGSFSGAPDFAYRICAERVMREPDLQIDLRSWSVAFNAAEPIRRETISAFNAAMAPYGFNPTAMRPVYGLAEATLVVTGSTRIGPVHTTVDRSKLEIGQLEPANVSSGVQIVSSGRPAADNVVLIVDPDNLQERMAGEVGEILVAGSSVCDGYWSSRSGDVEPFTIELPLCDGKWLRTGDLGSLVNGELYVTGRLKDLLIVRGRNLYPQDLERSAELACSDWQNGAAAALQDNETGDVVIIQELRRPWSEDLPRISNRIVAAVVQDHEIRPHRIVIVQSGTLLKTTSGKLRRAANLEALRSSAFKTYADSASPPLNPPVNYV